MRSILLPGKNRVFIMDFSSLGYLNTILNSKLTSFHCVYIYKLMLQLVFDILLTSLTILIICGVLIALQFPIVMSSPITALSFAMLMTVSLGSVSAKVGTILAPLPIFALILVSTHISSNSLPICTWICWLFLMFRSISIYHKIYRT